MSSTNGTAQDVGDKSGSVTIQDAAHLLRCSSRSVHRHIRRYGIRTERVFTPVGHQLRIARADVDAIAQRLRDRLADRVPLAATLSDTGNGAAGGGNGHGAGRVSDTVPSLPALQDAQLERLGDVIRQAVAQGVLDALQRHQTAQHERQDLRKPPATSRARRWAVGALYALLVVTLACSLGAAFLLASRIASIGTG